MLIRRAVANDAACLRSMLYLAMFVPPGEDPFPLDVVSEPPVARYVDGWGRPGDVGRVADLDGRAIGAAWVRRWSADDRGYGWVDDGVPELSMAVVPEYRGRGVGALLLGALLEAEPKMSLSVDRRNDALRLYGRAGFVVVAQFGETLTMRRR